MLDVSLCWVGRPCALQVHAAVPEAVAWAHVPLNSTNGDASASVFVARLGRPQNGRCFCEPGSIGSYIARKRREENLTQEQLAERLGVSNKTVSKWENGKCMPDYGVVQWLCGELHVTLPELMDGEDAAQGSVRVYDDEQILDLLRRTQELERQKGILYGLVLIVLGIACGAMSRVTGGTDVQDLVSGILMGLSVGEVLVGVWAVGRELLGKE